MTRRRLAGFVAAAAAALFAAGCSIQRDAGASLAARRSQACFARPAETSPLRALPAFAGAGYRRDTDRFVSAGPRFGLVWVTRDLAASLEYEHDARSPLTAWGWQFEYQHRTSPEYPVWLAEFVPFVTGLEQGLSLPGINVLAGVRGADGTEFMAGPYISPNTVAVRFAVGHTFRAGRMSFPFNCTAAHNADGERHSLTVGWNIRR